MMRTVSANLEPMFSGANRVGAARRTVGAFFFTLVMEGPGSLRNTPSTILMFSHPEPQGTSPAEGGIGVHEVGVLE